MRSFFLFLIFYALHDAYATPLQVLDKFELKLHHAQTRTRRRSLTGPARASDATRAEALANTAKVVEETNAKYKAGTKSYFLGYNELSDLTVEQYRAFLGSRPDKDSGKRKQKTARGKRGGVQRGKTMAISFDLGTTESSKRDEKLDESEIPKEVDWTRKEGGKYVTPIKNQGTCGSCWAFAGVSVVESRFAIENRVQASILSVEQVLSCSAPLDHIQSKFYDNMTSSSEGCGGGMPFLTYAYLKFVAPHGISCESTYPYWMATNETETQCLPLTKADVAVAWEQHVSDYKVVAANEQALLRAVTQGPVTANIDATGDGFRHYGGGIYDAQDCESDGNEVNHAVVVVGFGQTPAGEPYWILRNTWGTMWGEDGYMRIARGRNVSTKGPCNLYLYADYPVNLTLGSDAINGHPACAMPTPTFVPLSFLKLIGLSSNQIVLFVLSTVLSVILGLAFYHGTEWRQDRKQAAGTMTFQDKYARWILPSRDQIAATLARRNARRHRGSTT